MSDWRADILAIHGAIVTRWLAWSAEDARFLALALAGEVGEALNLVKKEWRGDYDADAVRLEIARGSLAEELADIRIYLELLARACRVDLDEACAAKVPKLLDRWPAARAAMRPRREGVKEAVMVFGRESEAGK